MKIELYLNSKQCKTCTENFVECEHRVLETQREKRFRITLKQVVKSINESKIINICSHYELESDEFSTREQKAAIFLN